MEKEICMFGNYSKCWSGINNLKPVLDQENRSSGIPACPDFIGWHTRSKEAKLTTVLIIPSVLSLILTF